jgi:recombination protein RecA
MSIEIELPITREQKVKAADVALAALNKEYGKGTLQKLGNTETIERIPSIPTSLPTLDEYQLGIGGIARGSIVEIFGPESSGKTTLTLRIIAEAQKLGDLAAFVDAEHALDIEWAAKNGVDVSELAINQPDSGEQGLEIVIRLVDSGAYGIIVVDSVAALVPQAELDGEMGDSHMGLQARMMSQACRKLAGRVKKTNTVVIFINQIREKIGVMFGSPETTTGGRALKFYASVRLDVRRIGVIKEGDAIVGSRTKIKVVKNKKAAPFRESEYDLRYDIGFDALADFVDYATKLGILEKAGAWYTIDGFRVQGKDKVKEFLSENEEIYNKLYERLVKKINE